MFLSLLLLETGLLGLLLSIEKCHAIRNLFCLFSSRKTIPLLGSWQHPHKYQRKAKAFIFDGLPCLLQAVTKISTVYNFHKGHSVADRCWQF